MVYQEIILEKLENMEQWPYFERPEFFDTLNKIASEAFKKDTIEGYLASILIYHQLTEESIKVLISCSTFYIQLSVFPQEYQNRDHGNKMFGKIIQDLKESVLDYETKKIIERALKINDLRIKVVHHLAKTKNLSVIKKQSTRVQIFFDEIDELFETVYDNYRVTFGHFRKNIDELRQLLEEFTL